jgi:hypothetical protein
VLFGFDNPGLWRSLPQSVREHVALLSVFRLYIRGTVAISCSGYTPEYRQGYQQNSKVKRTIGNALIWTNAVMRRAGLSADTRDYKIPVVLPVICTHHEVSQFTTNFASCSVRLCIDVQWRVVQWDQKIIEVNSKSLILHLSSGFAFSFVCFYCCFLLQDLKKERKEYYKVKQQTHKAKVKQNGRTKK